MGWVSLYLKWGSNNHFKGCREDQRRISIWKCCVNCPPRTCIVLKKELRILSRRISRNLPALLSSWCFPHSQDEAGLSPGRTKECLWASQEAREIGIGTLIANLFKFLMIS